MDKGAILSKCYKYRYQLWRIWDRSKPRVMFIMLNPSTADANIDDPTIRRCIGFAKSWGYGGLYVGNLFAFRATKPTELLSVSDPTGELNLQNIILMMAECEMVIFAWGNESIIKKFKANKILKMSKSMYRDNYYIELAKGGTPKHPLYLKGDLKPKLFEVNSS